MMRMCWYILGTCQLVKVFWYFRSNTFDECCQKTIWLLPNCCRYVFDYRKNLKKFLIVESVDGLYDCWNYFQVLPDFSDCCHNFLIVANNSRLLSQNCLIVTQDYLIAVWIFWLLSCCQNFVIYVRIFWLLKLLMDRHMWLLKLLSSVAEFCC